MDTWAIIGVVVAAVGVIIGAVKWMLSEAAKKGSNDQTIKDIQAQISSHYNKSVDCERRFIQLEECKIDNKSLKNISEDIAFIKGVLFSGDRKGDLIQANSPITLSDSGKSLAKQMNLEARIFNNWDKICEFLDNNLNSKNAYDIQQFCLQTASVFPERFFSTEDVEFIKNFAYNEGKPLFYYGCMIGVLIRDAYFKHKNISIDDVDKHDPAKIMLKP